MSVTADMAARHREILTELAELGLSLARDVHARAVAATDDHAKAELTLAFQRTSRSVRQTLALEARLERDQLAASRDEAKAERARTFEQVRDKRWRVRRAVSRLIWSEAEDEEVEELLAALDLRLTDEEEAGHDAFLSEPVEALIERLRQDLGLADPHAPANTTDACDGDGDGIGQDGETPGEGAAEPVTVTIWKSSG